MRLRKKLEDWGLSDSPKPMLKPPLLYEGLELPRKTFKSLPGMIMPPLVPLLLVRGLLICMMKQNETLPTLSPLYQVTWTSTIH